MDLRENNQSLNNKIKLMRKSEQVMPSVNKKKKHCKNEEVLMSVNIENDKIIKTLIESDKGVKKSWSKVLRKNKKGPLILRTYNAEKVSVYKKAWLFVSRYKLR